MDKIDNNDKSIYNTKSLYLLNIKELRSIGRQIGVPAPASKSKAQLVDYILKIIYGELDAPARNNFGRPSKNDYNIDECLSKIKKNSFDKSKIKSYKYEDDFKDFGMKLVSSKSEAYKFDDNIETRIYCVSSGKHYLRKKAFIESDDDILISESFANKYHFASMDIVEIVKCKDYFKIYSINGVKIKNNAPITIGDSVVYWGRSQDFYLSTKEEIKQKINNLINWCKDKDVMLSIFSNDIYVENNTFCMNYDKDAEYTQIYKKLMLFLDKCDSLALSGENTIMVIDDKALVEKVICSFDDDIFMRIKKHLNEVLSNMVEVGNICILFKVQEEFKY